MNPELVIKTYQGKEGSAFIDDLARLRISVFREYPYLYDGDAEYEKKYLSRYFSIPSSFLVLASIEQKIIGASTAMHLKDELKEFKEPFEKNSFDTNSICYFGESVLLPEYRGLGIGKIFMQKRIDFARTILKAKYSCFCAVQRNKNDTRKPQDYKPLDEFWIKLGFEKVTNLTTSFAWKELGETTESNKLMQFWLKPL
ncbi:MAG: GNAT family N-acetyltransferase [Oligoflexia bacterium]|nr:GNAT family N-acetyltransferase [Oligoflexia bacterium]